MFAITGFKIKFAIFLQKSITELNNNQATPAGAFITCNMQDMGCPSDNNKHLKI